MTTKITKKQSDALWTKLRESFLDAGKTLDEIFAKKAWLPEYDTFTAAWSAHMAGVRIGSFINPAAVMYQMLEEGATVEEIADAVEGVSPAIAESVKKQRDAGVPRDKAKARRKPIIVRRHRRKRPKPAAVIRIEVGHDAFVEYTAIAKEYDTTVAEVFREAGEKAFAELGELITKDES
jgi:hypothetical protein